MHASISAPSLTALEGQGSFGVAALGYIPNILRRYGNGYYKVILRFSCYSFNCSLAIWQNSSTKSYMVRLAKDVKKFINGEPFLFPKKT